MKKNFFCKLPFIHTASSPAGENLVCCEGNGDGSRLNDGVGPYDFLNSEFMNEMVSYQKILLKIKRSKMHVKLVL